MSDTSNNKALLGIFDSGVGGFTVYRKIRNVTRANSIYYGDTARAPYGNRSEKEIISFIKDDIEFLQEKGVTHFVNACNSMSVHTTDLLLKECHISPLHYVDMIRAFDAHAEFPEDAIVLVVATQATIRSGAYQDVLTKKGIRAHTFAYEDLAHMIENNVSYEEEAGIDGGEFAPLGVSKAGASVEWDLHYFTVRNAVIGEQDLEEGEQIQTVVLSAQEIFEKLSNGEVQEGRSAEKLWVWLAKNNLLHFKS